MRRVHRKPAGGPRHDRRRPRRSIVRRSASTRRDRTSLLEKFAHPSARRSNLGSRQRSRGGDPRRAFAPHARANRHRRCASAVNASEFRSDRRLEEAARSCKTANPSACCRWTGHTERLSCRKSNVSLGKRRSRPCARPRDRGRRRRLCRVTSRKPWLPRASLTRLDCIEACATFDDRSRANG